MQVSGQWMEFEFGVTRVEGHVISLVRGSFATTRSWAAGSYTGMGPLDLNIQPVDSSSQPNFLKLQPDLPLFSYLNSNDSLYSIFAATGLPNTRTSTLNTPIKEAWVECLGGVLIKEAWVVQVALKSSFHQKSCDFEGDSIIFSCYYIILLK